MPNDLMKAIVFTKYGSPDFLEFKDVAIPTPKEDEVLVRVHASSINSWDWEYLMGAPFVNRIMFGLRRPRRGKQRLGADIAGVVDSVGSAVTRFKRGDAVFGDLWDRWGGFAEFACASESGLELKPSNISFEEAATLPQAGVLALQGLRKGTLGTGKKVLVNGAGGGVGIFSVQLAKHFGAEVTGVDAKHKLDVVRALGAARVMDYEVSDFVRSGEQFDLIVDCQCRRSMFELRRALLPGGVYAMIGGAMSRVYQLWLFNILELIIRPSRTFRLVAEGPNKGLNDLSDLMAAGQLVPVIDSTFLLKEVPKALRYFGEGQHKGKIVIRISE